MFVFRITYRDLSVKFVVKPRLGMSHDMWQNCQKASPESRIRVSSTISRTIMETSKLMSVYLIYLLFVSMSDLKIDRLRGWLKLKIQLRLNQWMEIMNVNSKWNWKYA